MKLITPNPQIFMTLNGHFYDDHGERFQISTNDAGLPVFEMCSDYQGYPNGGNGWLRKLVGMNSVDMDSVGMDSNKG